MRKKKNNYDYKKLMDAKRRKSKAATKTASLMVAAAIAFWPVSHSMAASGDEHAQQGNSKVEGNQDELKHAEDGDSEPPEVKNVEVNPKRAEVGDTVNIKADIEDEKSEVDSSHISFESPSGNREVNVHLEKEDSGTWEGSYDVQENDERGEWELRYISAWEDIGNHKNYYSDDLKNNLDFVINSESDVSGEIVWQDEGDENRPESVTANLLADGEEVDSTTVDSSDKEYEFTDLDKYDDEGSEIKYTVEAEDVDGYESEAEDNDITYTSSRNTDVSGEIVWQDEDDEARPDSVTANLLADDEKVNSTTVDSSDKEYKFTDLDKFDDEGNKVEYTVEVEDIDGYDTEVDNNDITYISNNKDIEGFAHRNVTYVYDDRDSDADILKSYNIGDEMEYRESDHEDWYKATVFINGDEKKGYIQKDDVGEDEPDEVDKIEGFAQKEPTEVYREASADADAWKSYEKGTTLEYHESDEDGWYEATVFADGQWRTGYIHEDDVDSLVEDQESKEGYAHKNVTYVYDGPNEESNILKSYDIEDEMVYKAYSSEWYKATVVIDHEEKTGYIKKEDVDEESPEVNEDKNGVAQNSPTSVYKETSSNADTWKSYKQGTVLEYHEFNQKGWYEATVYAEGQWRTGYIQEDDVDSLEESQEKKDGYAQQNVTHVYKGAHEGSDVLKSYNIGDGMEYKSYSSNWYEATVVIDGEEKTGYIKKQDVDEEKPEVPDDIEGYAKKDPTPVYQGMSTEMSTWKTYEPNTALVYHELGNDSWYEATVYASGQWRTGYIHKNDVNDHKQTKSANYDLTFDEAVEVQMDQEPLPQTDLYGNTAYVRAEDIEDGEVVAEDGTTARQEPSSSSYEVGDLLYGAEVVVQDKGDDWYEILHTFKNAKSEDVETYLNPDNFDEDSSDYYQFLDLSESANATLKEVNKNILDDNGILEGKAKAFLDGAREHGINELYLISHAVHESGEGTSPLATGIDVGKDEDGELQMVDSDNEGDLSDIKTTYNMYGIGAVDAAPEKEGSKRAYENGWFTPEEAIKGGAEFVAEDYIDQGQDTLYKMRWDPDHMETYESENNEQHQYATDIGWAAKQTSDIYDYYGILDSYSLKFELPTYKKE